MLVYHLAFRRGVLGPLGQKVDEGGEYLVLAVLSYAFRYNRVHLVLLEIRDLVQDGIPPCVFTVIRGLPVGRAHASCDRVRIRIICTGFRVFESAGLGND